MLLEGEVKFRVGPRPRWHLASANEAECARCGDAMVDYSKWDNLQLSDDEDDAPAPHTRALHSSSSATTTTTQALHSSGSAATTQQVVRESAPPGLAQHFSTSKKGAKRRQFFYKDQLVYEWEQSIDELLLYIKTPPGLKASSLNVVIEPLRVCVGIRGNPPYMDHQLSKAVKSESTWTFEDGELEITLFKVLKAETWLSVFVGHEGLDAATEMDVKKDILLERFQEEHPGFDFRNATVNGMVPDPSKFMGGVSGL